MFRNMFLMLVLANLASGICAAELESNRQEDSDLDLYIENRRSPVMQISAHTPRNSLVFANQEAPDQENLVCCKEVFAALMLAYIPFTLAFGYFLKSKSS